MTSELLTGKFYASESCFNDGTWDVYRVSEENSPAWDRLTLTRLTKAQATAIAKILSEG